MKCALVLLFFCLPAWAVIENPYLYEVKKGSRVSWMLGTQHLGIDISELIHFIEPRLKASRRSYSEVLVSNERIELWATDPASAVLTSSEVDFSQGRPLSNRMKELLKSNFDIPDKLLRKLTSESCFAVALFDHHRASPRTLDYQILQLAEKLEIPRSELDSDELRAKAKEADRQGRLARLWNCDMESRATRKSTAREFVKFISEEYRLGRAKPGIELPMEGVALRNRAWVETLVPELEIGSIFVSVGLGHMHGPNGLIELLRERGFTVTRFPHPED